MGVSGGGGKHLLLTLPLFILAQIIKCKKTSFAKLQCSSRVLKLKFTPGELTQKLGSPLSDAAGRVKERMK